MDGTLVDTAFDECENHDAEVLFDWMLKHREALRLILGGMK